MEHPSEWLCWYREDKLQIEAEYVFVGLSAKKLAEKISQTN